MYSERRMAKDAQKIPILYEWFITGKETQKQKQRLFFLHIIQTIIDECLLQTTVYYDYIGILY